VNSNKNEVHESQNEDENMDISIHNSINKDHMIYST